MAAPNSTTGVLSKGVSLSMQAYADTPTWADTNIVANLQEFPDLLGTPDAVDITCLADASRRYI